MRLLYDSYLAGEKWKDAVAVAEARIYVAICNRKRSIYYWKRGGKDLKCWL